MQLLWIMCGDMVTSNPYLASYMMITNKPL